MKKIFTVVFLISVVISGQGQTFQDFIDYVNSLDTPQEKTEAVDSFMVVAEGAGVPYLEGDVANFIYRGEATVVQYAGDFNAWNPGAEPPFVLLSGTDFWYRPRQFEMNARLDYKLVLDGNNWILDPLNPNQISGGYGPNSELAMPEYIQPWEINYKADIEHGSLHDHNISSTNTGKTYEVYVYTPPNYQKNSTKYPTVYFHDGSDYLNLCSAENIIDNLIDSSLIEEVIAVFVRPTNRNEEYAGSLRNEYRLFFAEELVPFIDTEYSTIKMARARLVLGDSFGGNISALIAYNHADVFENCGLHSGAFWPNDYEAYELITNGEKKNIKWASVWGTYEGLYENMRDFRDFLESESYELLWKELPEGHSWGLWRATLDDMLKFFFPAGWLGVDENTNIAQIEVLVSPNPFSKSCKISFVVPSSGNWEFIISDVTGKSLNEFVKIKSKKGRVSILFEPKGMADSIYFYKLISDSKVSSGKLIKSGR